MSTEYLIHLCACNPRYACGRFFQFSGLGTKLIQPASSTSLASSTHKISLLSCNFALGKRLSQQHSNYDNKYNRSWHAVTYNCIIHDKKFPHKELLCLILLHSNVLTVLQCSHSSYISAIRSAYFSNTTLRFSLRVGVSSPPAREKSTGTMRNFCKQGYSNDSFSKVRILQYIGKTNKQTKKQNKEFLYSKTPYHPFLACPTTHSAHLDFGSTGHTFLIGSCHSIVDVLGDDRVNHGILHCGSGGAKVL